MCEGKFVNVNYTNFNLIQSNSFRFLEYHNKTTITPILHIFVDITNLIATHLITYIYE